MVFGGKIYPTPPPPTPFLLLSPYFTADTVVLDTRCLCHCCCLRILEPGGLELLNLGLLGRRPIYNYSNCGIF